MIRVHLGLAQGAFAARIGVSRNMVIAYERGHTTTRAATLRRIAAPGGVTVEALRDGSGPPWLQDGAWEKAATLLRHRVAGRRPSRPRAAGPCAR